MMCTANTYQIVITASVIVSPESDTYAAPDRTSKGDLRSQESTTIAQLLFLGDKEGRGGDGYN